MAIDYTPGDGSHAFVTIVYNSADAMLSVKPKYLGDTNSWPKALAMQGENVYVTGTSVRPSDATRTDILTVGYHIGDGVTLSGWPQRSNTAFASDEGKAIALSPVAGGGGGNIDGPIVVAGSSTGQDGTSDFLTISYNQINQPGTCAGQEIERWRQYAGNPA